MVDEEIFKISFYSHSISFSINVKPVSGKTLLLSLIAVSIDSTINSRDCFESMGRILHEKSPLIRFLIQSSNSSQLHEKIFSSTTILPPKNISRRVKTTALQCPVGSTGFIAYVFFSGHLLDLPFLRLIIVNCPFVKVDALVKSFLNLSFRAKRETFIPQPIEKIRFLVSLEITHSIMSAFYETVKLKEQILQERFWNRQLSFLK